MVWNYRVIKTDKVFAIHEVYYNEDGTICAISEDPMYPHGESIKELKGDAEHFLLAFNKPVLKREKIKFAPMDSENTGMKRGNAKKLVEEIFGKKQSVKKRANRG